ncbi:GGDEF domain-containing protein [Balneatrix alpica]|uniref:diguanylate cyclase n=1 Tax=Balneatrix alpica TaxID=75684 RepID=A0ABV5Z994_9GAMM|nr:GGDEF domain-containing protein [Balneatrix alpica]
MSSSLSILGSIVELTEQRDLDSLDYSLAASLAEMLPIQALRLYKLNAHEQWQEAELAVNLRIDTSQEGTAVQWLEQAYGVSPPGRTRVSWHEQRNVYTEDSGHHFSWCPILLNAKVMGALELESNNSLVDHDELIYGMTRIYSNYLFLLNESYKDKLTGLYNRRAFEQRVSQLSQQSQPEGRLSIWLAIVDIDHFKQVNDSYGHLYGDEILISLANALRQGFREQDRIYRFGGEEFVILFDAPSEERAHQRLNTVRLKVAERVKAKLKPITISVGYMRLDKQLYPTLILEKADKALYYAKEQGRNQVVSYAELVRTAQLSDEGPEMQVELF